MVMSKEDMAKKIANVCFSVKDERDPSFAVLLFFEHLLIPPEVDRYTEEEMARRILLFLAATS